MIDRRQDRRHGSKYPETVIQMANATQTTNVERGKWFQWYKPTQGHYTRLSTAIGAGALVVWGASWIFGKLSVYQATSYGLGLQVGAALAYIGVLGYLLFWAVGKNPGTVDFLISVEGEMKKVNWSTWPEIIGATKVVILFVVMMSCMLFIVDYGFMMLFSSLGVLKGPGFGSLISQIIHFFKK
jgi:preprotein translocase SecE subunit